jgi:hypothetical protein
MFSDWLQFLRSKLFRMLRHVVPKGSALDTIFDSYDDWRELTLESKPTRDERLS